MSQSQISTRNRISLGTRAAEGPPIGAWVAAVSLHVLIVVATLFTWTHRLDIADESSPVVPVDLVTIAPKTNIIATAPPTPKVQPDVAPTPPPPVPQPVTPPQEDTEPPPVDTAPSEPLIKAPPPPPVPMVKPQLAKPQSQPVKQKSTPDNYEQYLKQWADGSPAKPSNRPTKGVGAGTAMTADLKAILQSQIYNCWSPPPGAPDPSQLIVDLDISLNPDGSVAQAPQLTAESAAAAASNNYTRAAADAAKRAVIRCAPYKLPADQYSVWRVFTFRFDPRALMDQ